MVRRRDLDADAAVLEKRLRDGVPLLAGFEPRTLHGNVDLEKPIKPETNLPITP